MPERGYHHGDLRGALLDAAEALIRERGLDGWSLREASVRVGVSPSAAYHHFDSRDALVGALSQRILSRLGERLGRAAARARGDRIVAVGRSYIRWATEDPAVARLTVSARPTGPVSPHPHDIMVAELDRLVDAGRLPPAARPGAEFILWSAIHGLATLLIDGLMILDSPRATDRQAERLVRTILTGLAHEPPPPTPWPTAHSPHTERTGHS